MNTTTMRDRFNEKFVREDGLLDIGKYDYDVLLDFIEQELKKEREEIVEMIERYLGLARYGNLEEVDTCYERAFEDIISTIKNRV